MVPHPRTGWLLDYPQLCSDFCKIIKILLFYAGMLGAIGYSEMRISNDFAKFLPSGEIVSKDTKLLCFGGHLNHLCHYTGQK